MCGKEQRPRLLLPPLMSFYEVPPELLWCVLKTNGTYKLQITASAGAFSHRGGGGLDGVCWRCVYVRRSCWLEIANDGCRG